ncbi:Phosphoglycerate mutase [Catenulispora acidiphila DSM 44928]|uniref:Phosphoglycerate mutase n=1 Tax=Catenulispora acidiphila (strain DSM 44928 / JCM 14897 / NBRC 102108 / NRRL B-24433 / ID139908) TaxID=479433 RepID=C7QH56_CATAD|nr:histidine phosphatase family protein [Catenulispora acidiphila]ACU76906.1 Phosphoglycerate mutase [Catenulispora acidiphila DSM 44928]
MAETKTVVHLMRHGEVYNPDGILYGRLPGFRLSDLGRKMAERVADHLADHDVKAVVASPLQRAQETAAPIAARHDLEIGTDERLIEAANFFEGKKFSVGDGVLKRPAVWFKLWNPFKPSWGEPYKEQVKRMHAALLAAAELAPGHEVVLVSHQLPIWISRLAAEHRSFFHDPRKRECTLASLTSFEITDGRITAVRYSEPAKDLLPVKNTKKFVAGA